MFPVGTGTLCDWHRQRGEHQLYSVDSPNWLLLAAIGTVLHFWQIVWLELADPTSASLPGWLFRKQHANHKRIPTVPDQPVFHNTEYRITKVQLAHCFQSLASSSQIVDHLYQHAPRSGLSGFVQDL